MAETYGLELVAQYLERDDDVDSLFGDETEPASLFTDAGAVEPSQEPDCEPASPLSQERPHQATNPAAQLDSRHLQAHAQSTQSTPHHGLSFPQLALPVPQLSLPAVPDPPGAFLSHQDGHTSGDLVVSTKDSTYTASRSGIATASPEEALDDAALEAELEGLWEATPSHEQPVNAHAESRENDAIQREGEILATQIPGFRYANSNTNSFIRLPRRVDRDQKLAEDLGYYITLNRQTKVEVLYSYLELNMKDGKRLSGDMKKLLKEPPLIGLVEQTTSAKETKKTLIRIALYMLMSKEWGRTWFGEDNETAASRKLLWPRDSSIIVAAFVMVLYRTYTNLKQVHQANLRAEARVKNANHDAAPSSPPPSPSPSPLARRANSPSAQRASSPQSPTPTPEGQSFFEALAKDACAAKKRKHTEAVLGLNQNPIEVEVPANARLKYHVYIKDKDDGADVAPPTTYRHTDYVIARGAFSSLKAAFAAAGHDPAYVIQTPFGRKLITCEDDWESAVLSIYNVRRAGGVVEVDVFV
ncbi:hypothetical protein C8A01DRAFT_43167 [Parachaetomium inaequale]|uniref:Uncharacterized protein n=1 Tax=Parachaetomium inaequale TaxID=2588326 RepID=A0AAN6PSY5_9PEZI|nr:hypothetical protein C8A01DRAFT_43167 [Parachaetomium inaequale]